MNTKNRDTKRPGQENQTPEIMDTAAYLFHEGTNFTAYEYLGAHPTRGGVVFRVWAPAAQAVSLTGDFNGWNPAADPMTRSTDNGVWELTLPDFNEYDLYKYAVTGPDGKTVLKSDPYAFHAETRPGTASRYYDLDRCHEWGDGQWIKQREKTDIHRAPLNIYELHAGSWKKYPDGSPYSYEKLAEELIPYVKKMGYTHIELMPLSEYPLDMSWGYQITGYFAPTSRYGTPAGLMAFIDSCHRAGVGVIMDWVGAHFPKDEHGLYMFDGSCCYEYSDPLKRESPEWGTHYFDYGKNEVVSFLVSNADYWINRYHLDGLRVDAVSAMLYLDYGRQEWRPNALGGHENLEAMELLRKINSHILTRYPGTMMIAEESTAFPYITAPVEDGGLGFSFKWNMGWMHDTLDYMATDPFFRKYQHGKLTFSLTYAFSEHYILPVSHDEVVHGKKSLLDKMPGDYWCKFANTRLFMAYMLAHPGKKLMFMGCEYGPFREWDYDDSLEWFMTDYEAHSKLRDYKSALDEFYLHSPSMWEIDDGWDGFDWISVDDADNNLLVFTRSGKKGDRTVCAFNFSPVVREDYPLKLKEKTSLTPIFCSDDTAWYGSGVKPAVSAPLPEKEGGCTVKITLPPLAAVFYKPGKEGTHPHDSK